MLSERQKLVLKTIVEEYVSTNEPVGSRTLSRLEWFSASPATLRNDMADLENLGYLVKTHSSSGRIPSEKGYRFYVEEMMKKEQESISECSTRIFSELYVLPSANMTANRVLCIHLLHH